MTRRDEIQRRRLQESISVHDLQDGEVSILCPESIAAGLSEQLITDGISCSQPKQVIFGEGHQKVEHPDFELIVTLDEGEAKRRVASFIENLPYNE
ncbi:MAG: hypothetical protein R3F19_16500 [Verrucomicrobiales bacterium]